MGKNLTFGKLMAIFGGVLLLALIGTVVMVKMNNSQPPVVQRRPPVVDNFEQERRAQEEAAAAEAASKSADTQSAISNSLASIQSQIATQASLSNQRLDNLGVETQALAARVEDLEMTKTKTVATKPKRPSADSAAKRLVRNALPLSSSSGYDVRATVGNRAWIQAGDKEVSVSVGDTLPPTPALRVIAVENNSGVVITSPESTKR